ncbi:hypothetical protein [Shewanella fodinae]|jgi:hypothetical protein|uniref:hypothetical protein n=1 Tax=Shewanella fodinae TaxID=552357 RepID=UPI0016748E96|nr:hypothetical protein [Shewanella fodinae]MCL2905779.1 hypothetical protein [Shewanella fodinae]GGY96996.1 Mu phage protein [Shewanella fodinae]
MEFYHVQQLSKKYKEACEQKSELVTALFECLNKMKDDFCIEVVGNKDVIKLFDCDVKLVHRAVLIGDYQDCYCALDFIYLKNKDTEHTITTLFFDQYGSVFWKHGQEFAPALNSREADTLTSKTLKEKVIFPVTLALMEHLKD